MQSLPSFRVGHSGDMEVLVAMMRQLYANDSEPFHEERSRRAAEQLMADPRCGAIWMIDVEGLPVGYVVMTKAFSLEFGGWHSFIDELFVAASHRGRGLGTAAVRHLESECAREGIAALLLEANLNNEKATRLYRRLGFHEHPRRLMTLWVGMTDSAS